MLAALVLLRPTRKCENVVRIFIVLNFLDLLCFPWWLPFHFFCFGGGSISRKFRTMKIRTTFSHFRVGRSRTKAASITQTEDIELALCICNSTMVGGRTKNSLVFPNERDGGRLWFGLTAATGNPCRNAGRHQAPGSFKFSRAAKHLKIFMKH